MRTTTIEALRARVQALPLVDPRVVVSGNHAVPWQLLVEVDKALPSYRLFMLNAPHGIPTREGVTHETPFVGVGMRGSDALAYYPCRLSLVPSLLKAQTPPDIVLLHTAPPRHGLLSLGVEVNVLPAAIEAARARGALVVAQVNPRMPYTYGDSLVPVEEVDLAIDVDEPVPAMPCRPVDDEQRAIGAHVAALVPDGATLQLGIGAIPDAALELLRTRRGLRIWTEMLSDGVLGLERAGALGDGLVTTSFAAGSAELHDWLDGNERVIFCRTERTNDPATIARQPLMTSVNAALQVDLFAQANASFVNGRIYSGFGGQTDFIVGALHASAGRAIVALPSWHAKSATSTIVRHLPGPATSFQHSYVVTEQGAAAIWGRPQAEQAHELIERAAAPAARDDLRAAARELFGPTALGGT
jgi:acyl-CoA hydrolase